MTPEGRKRVADLYERLRDRVPTHRHDDVEDWLEHGEWALALEMLADALYEAGVVLNAEERAAFAQAAEASGESLDAFDFILGARVEKRA